MKHHLSILALFLCCLANAQETKIIEKNQYVISDSSVRTIEKVIPNIKSIISSVNFYHITYVSDGLKVKGYLCYPKKAGKYPCIIYNRGGNKEFGKITDEGFLIRGIGELSHAGYLVIASQYRGNDGGDGIEEFGGKDVNDVLNLIPLLSTILQADTSRIGMFGWSRGGMMTYIALTKTKRIKAAVVGSGIPDLLKLAESRPDIDSIVFALLIPSYTTDKTTVLKERSAVYLTDKINRSTPILIFQGTADWRVPTNQVLELVNEFYESKQPFRFILFEGGEHSLLEHRKEYVSQMISWFHIYLRDGKSWPSLELHGD